ncbi:MAG TPA: hypothetical protein VM581_00760 [Magnetospirillaceae bacterium]|nr:hypothetical protein [Magnetospirillaceae bacterium]
MLRVIAILLLVVVSVALVLYIWRAVTTRTPRENEPLYVPSDAANPDTSILSDSDSQRRLLTVLSGRGPNQVIGRGGRYRKDIVRLVVRHTDRDQTVIVRAAGDKPATVRRYVCEHRGKVFFGDESREVMLGVDDGWPGANQARNTDITNLRELPEVGVQGLCDELDHAHYLFD